MSNIQLPVRKLAFLLMSSIEAHILFEFEHLDVGPNSGALHTCSNNICTATLDDNRENLLEVTSKNNSKTAKWFVWLASYVCEENF